MHTKGKLIRLLSGIPHLFHGHRGSFHSGTFSNAQGSRPYKLYVPSLYSSATPVPLLVALHGCSQDPDNFAAGTHFNALADTNNFLVLYPQQTSAANPNRCWNWFLPQNQERGKGEPASIVALVDDIRTKYTVDPRRIFITGMSSGGAMAVIVAACYPDYFAALGVHSGLEFKAASNLVSAQIAMAQGGPDPRVQGRLAYLSAGVAARVLPVIVFQGTADFTVAPVNGEQVIQQFISTDDYADDGLANNSISPTPSSMQTGQVPDGYFYTIDTYTYRNSVLMQYYKIDGMGHAWSGGSANPPATFVDPRGPDASLLMWQFFADHPKDVFAALSTAARPGSDPARDEVIEGTFRYVQPERKGTALSASPGTTLTLKKAPPAGSTSTETGIAILHSIGSENGYVMSNFPFVGDLSVGSLAGAQQYAIVSFDTSRIPANAVVESVTLKIVRNYASAGDAFGKLGDLVVDIKGGSGFGGSPALEPGDGNAPADASAVCIMSTASGPGAISEGKISSSAFRYINRAGRTQFRLRFTQASATRYGTDYAGFYGGHMTNALENRPSLIIVYHTENSV
jgi:poly(hydroxyalkanoate) depolymerase family esterase